jgi:hypothetical protein
MKTNYLFYYCFLKQGLPRILETKPSDFEKLRSCYVACCPNIEIAELTYRANLKIRQWQSAA